MARPLQRPNLSAGGMEIVIYRYLILRINGAAFTVLVALVAYGFFLSSATCFAAAHEPMPLSPSQGSTPSTNPPVFSWPLTGNGPFIVELETPDKGVQSYQTTHNGLTLNRVLLPGQYRWRFRHVGGAPGEWLAFNVSSKAFQQPLPTAASLITLLASKAHPRTVDKPTLQASANSSAFTKVMDRVYVWSQQALPLEPSTVTARSNSAAENNALITNVRRLVFDEEDKILMSALGWLVTGNPVALTETKRRALNLAGMSPTGMTGFLKHDQAGRSVAWTLALAYDWMYSEWTTQERETLLAAIAPRLADMLGTGPYGLDRARALDRNPYDSHGGGAMARTAVICTVLVGEGNQFDQCFSDVVPRYFAWPVSWGRDDGGFANGTAYAQWSVLYTHFVVWDLLKNALGVDLWQTPWARGYGQFIAYFLPPGTPSGLFGDEVEKRYSDVWATQGKAYAAHLPAPLADWYARNQFGEQTTHLGLLLAPQRDWQPVSGALPRDTPKAIHMPSIGWVAMHSNLADRGRSSVYFKSSPYGSYNHSHADQNSFVINSKGQSLAIDSGYYDYYNSPHWKGWYKQTWAHNAMTFDGGQGQMHDTMAAKGKITQFETTAAYDLVTGDATQAYGGALTRAVRSMVYVRPGVLLVFDSLASDTPRTWEWNIHALRPMAVTDKRSIEIEKEGERLCVEVLRGPDMGFSQTDQFTHAPSGDYPKQWHGVFKSGAKSKAFQMLTMLSVNCEKPSVEVTDGSEGLGVALAGHRFVFSGSSVERVQ